MSTDIRSLSRKTLTRGLVQVSLDLKIMDGGYGEAALYADAGANAVVVMGRAHDATIERVCDAARDLGLLVMGDDLGAEDPVAEVRRMEALGVGMVLHHTGHDHRSVHPELRLSPLTDGDLLSVLTDAVARVHAQEVVYPKGVNNPFIHSMKVIQAAL